DRLDRGVAAEIEPGFLLRRTVTGKAIALKERLHARDKPALERVGRRRRAALGALRDRSPRGLDRVPGAQAGEAESKNGEDPANADFPDRKSTRLNSSHQIISYAVFCL